MKFFETRRRSAGRAILRRQLSKDAHVGAQNGPSRRRKRLGKSRAAPELQTKPFEDTGDGSGRVFDAETASADCCGQLSGELCALSRLTVF
jgi:hypothetical protein